MDTNKRMAAPLYYCSGLIIFLIYLSNQISPNQMIHIHQSRTYSLQILKKYPNDLHQAQHPTQKDCNKLAENTQSCKKEANITQILKERSQIKLSLNKISKDALQFINKISARKYVKTPLKINYQQHLDHNNQKIERLYTEIKKAQNRLDILSDEPRQNKKAYSIQQQRKRSLKKKIQSLSRKIDSNSKQLIEHQCANNLAIFDMQKQLLKLNMRLKHIRQKNDVVAQKNQSKIQRIKQLQAKIKEYQASNVLTQIQQQNRKEKEYQNKMKLLQKLKVTSKRQRNRLQHMYFRKLKDLQYELACCEAIDNKIDQLQTRIDENQIFNAEDSQAPQKLLKIVNSHMMLSKNNRSTSEPSFSKEQSSSYSIRDVSTSFKYKHRQNSTVQVKKSSYINNMQEIKKKRLMSGVQPIRKNE